MTYRMDESGRVFLATLFSSRAFLEAHISGKRENTGEVPAENVRHDLVEWLQTRRFRRVQRASLTNKLRSAYEE